MSYRASLTPRHGSGRSDSESGSDLANALLTTVVDGWLAVDAETRRWDIEAGQAVCGGLPRTR